MRKFTLFILLPLLLVFGLAQAQDTEQAKQKLEEKTRTVKEAVDVDHLLGVMKLPDETREAREAGIPEKEVRQVVEEARKRGLSAEETGAILREGGKATRENGCVEGFGAFVRERLDKGMRGRELSDAIHAEHQLRGKGKGQGHDKGKGSGQSGKQNKNQNQNMNKGQDKNQEMEQEKETEGAGKDQDKGKGKGQSGQKGGKSNDKNK